MAEKRLNSKGNTREHTFIKGLGFCSIDSDGNTSEIDVKDGKIIRIRPLHFDKKYKPEEIKPWKIEARGKTFEPAMKILTSSSGYQL